MSESRHLIDNVLRAHVQHEERGHLVHPLVKIVFVVGPMFVGAGGLLIRFFGYTLENLWLVLALLVILTCQSLDFRITARRRTIQWLLVLLVATLFLALALFDLIEVEAIIRVLTDNPVVHLFEHYITANDILLMAMFAAAARGVLRLSASDVLWFRQFILFRRLEHGYVVAVVTYYVIQSTLKQRIGEAWQVGRSKRLQLLRTQPRARATALAAKLFTQRLLMGFEELGRNAESLLHERGLFDVAAINEPDIQASVEDVIAVVIAVLFVVMLVAAVSAER